MGKKQKQEVRQTERERQCKKISKQRANRQRFKLIARRVGMVLSVAVVLSGGTAAWSIYHSGKLAKWQQQAVGGFWQLTADAGFRVQNVYLSGHKKVGAKAILAALDVQKGSPILALPLGEVQARLEQLPLVHHVQVARILPDTLRVMVQERQGVAVWQNQGKLQLVDADGVALEPVKASQYTQMPLLVGKMQPQHVQAFFVFLDKTPALKNRMESATLVNERRWNIVLKKGVEIKMPEGDLNVAWEKLGDEEAQKMLQREDIEVIDLRVPDRMFIRQTKPLVSDKGAQNT